MMRHFLGLWLALLVAPALMACEPDQEKAETPPAGTVAPDSFEQPVDESPGEQTASSEAEDDFDYDGLPPGPGREEVFMTCSACHSLKLVQQQGLSQRRWREVLDWMVEEQGMAPLEPSAHDLVLNYLATHYGVPE